MLDISKSVAMILIGSSVSTLALAMDQPVPIAAPAPATATNNAGKIVCKREATTGSFVNSRKVCRSRAEWNRLAESTRDEMRGYVDQGRGGSNGR